MRYVKFVTVMSTNTRMRFRADIFWRFGSYAEEILCDNIKRVAIKWLQKQADSMIFHQFEGFTELSQCCAIHIAARSRA